MLIIGLFDLAGVILYIFIGSVDLFLLLLIIMAIINISFITVLKQTILNNKTLAKTYTINHPNSKYNLDDVINEIIYILQTGIAWRKYRGIFNFNTLYWHFSRFVNHEIFKKTFIKLRNKYIKLYSPTIQCIDTSFIQNKCGRDKLSYNKFYNNKRGNKISCVTDSFGVPLSIFLIKDPLTIYLSLNHI
jgi:hypothetical protein